MAPELWYTAAENDGTWADTHYSPNWWHQGCSTLETDYDSSRAVIHTTAQNDDTRAVIRYSQIIMAPELWHYSRNWWHWICDILGPKMMAPELRYTTTQNDGSRFVTHAQLMLCMCRHPLVIQCMQILADINVFTCSVAFSTFKAQYFFLSFILVAVKNKHKWCCQAGCSFDSQSSSSQSWIFSCVISIPVAALNRVWKSSCSNRSCS
jgi:hypothetical protein